MPQTNSTTIQSLALLSACLLLTACFHDSDSPQIQAPDFTQLESIDIQTTTVSGRFELDPGDFPGDYYNRGALLLEDQANNALTELGETWGDAEYEDLMVIVGTYDTTYAFRQGNGVPQNAQNTIAEDVVVNGPNQVIDITVPQVQVNSTFKYDGDDFEFVIYDSANFYLQPDGTDDLIHLGPSYTPFDDVMVTPGIYDVIYALQWGTLYAPNEHAVVMEDVEIDARNPNLAINVEVCTVAPDWKLVIDGGAPADFPPSIYTSAEFYLRNDQGDHVRLGVSYQDNVLVDVVEGTYDLVYTIFNGTGITVPRNIDTVIAEDIVIEGIRCPLDIVVNARTVTPDLSMNGSPFPASIYQSADIFLKDTITGGLTSIGPTYSPPDSFLIIESTYDTVYRRLNGIEVPVNTEADLPGQITIDNNNQTASVDVQAIALTGDFGINGGNFPASVYNSATIYLQQDGKEPVLLGRTNLDPEPVIVVAGTYDVVYEHAEGEVVPQNPHHIIAADQVYDSNGEVSFNILTRDVEVTFTLNGDDFPVSAYERGDLFLRGNHPNDLIYLGPTNAAAEAANVIQGDYDALYQFIQSEITVPINTEAIVGQILVD